MLINVKYVQKKTHIMHVGVVYKSYIILVQPIFNS